MEYSFRWRYITEANASKGIFAQAGNIGTLIIGEDLIGIGNCAFYECTGLDSISFGNGIKVIGNYAFAGCGSLRDVAIPDLCSLGQIGDHAFYSCTNLTSLLCPSCQLCRRLCFCGVPFLKRLCNV